MFWMTMFCFPVYHELLQILQEIRVVAFVDTVLIPQARSPDTLPVAVMSKP